MSTLDQPETEARPKSLSRQFFFHAGGLKRRHLAHEFYRGFDQVHQQACAGALAQAHLQVQQGRKPERVEYSAMASS